MSLRRATETSTSEPIDRRGQLERLARERFDLCVIGGGINGAALARDAAMRGLKVALVEKADFAGATSSRSSKLIHGGIRYLPQGQLRLVYEALRERERLRHLTAPHLVSPIRFLFPLYRGRGFGPFTLGIGLFLYDLFARPDRSERHRMLNPAGVRKLEPRLAPERLRGGALYYDAFADDARLTLENALDALYHGAAVANYVGLESFSRSAGRIDRAGLRDQLGGDTFELRASVFVNATGPWVDDIRRLDDPAAPSSVRLTKGIHIVIPRERLPVRESLVLSDDAGRIVFVMPRERNVLIGTTDTDFDGDRSRVSASREDLAYLIRVIGESLPGVGLDERDVISSFAGLRALLVGEPGKSPSAVPREETILESGSGLLSVAGGKLTTHRRIAQKLTDRVLKQLGLPAARCLTMKTPLPGARPAAPVSDSRGFETELCARLAERYGTRAPIVARLTGDSPELAEPLSAGCPVLKVEVIHAVRNEMAATLADFLVRRTSMVWRYPREAESAAPIVAQLMARELGWDSARANHELEIFTSDLKVRRAA